MDLELLEKGIWLGFAALGFGILFNVPKRNLLPIYFIGAIGGLIKFYLVSLDLSLVLSVLCGSSTVGFLSVYVSHYRKSPPVTFAIPSMIPMVPGKFAYNAMVGMVKLTGEKDPQLYSKILSETITSGLLAMFIILSLAIGVAIPLLISRKDSVKRLKKFEEIKEKSE